MAVVVAVCRGLGFTRPETRDRLRKADLPYEVADLKNAERILRIVMEED